MAMQGYAHLHTHTATMSLEPSIKTYHLISLLPSNWLLTSWTFQRIPPLYPQWDF